MTAIRIAIVLAVIGDLLCLWLLVRVSWYNFTTFMLVAQPLLVIAVLLFVSVLIRKLRVIRDLSAQDEA